MVGSRIVIHVMLDPEAIKIYDKTPHGLKSKMISEAIKKYSGEIIDIHEKNKLKDVKNILG